MSTLPPTPVADPNIPIVTPNGGSAAAYNDPNSPESIMKKTHSMNVQSKTDSKFDVASSPYESFQASQAAQGAPIVSVDRSIIWLFLIGLCLFIAYRYIRPRKYRPYLFVAVFLLLLTMYIYQKA